MEQYLSHHGIKGQKWGVRRFQNEDGSYTDDGRKRYRINSGSLNPGKLYGSRLKEELNKGLSVSNKKDVIKGVAATAALGAVAYLTIKGSQNVYKNMAEIGRYSFMNSIGGPKGDLKKSRDICSAAMAIIGGYSAAAVGGQAIARGLGTTVGAVGLSRSGDTPARKSIARKAKYNASQAKNSRTLIVDRNKSSYPEYSNYSRNADKYKEKADKAKKEAMTLKGVNASAYEMKMEEYSKYSEKAEDYGKKANDALRRA